MNSNQKFTRANVISSSFFRFRTRILKLFYFSLNKNHVGKVVWDLIFFYQINRRNYWAFFNKSKLSSSFLRRREFAHGQSAMNQWLPNRVATTFQKRPRHEFLF
jgi:hypothetical protein